MLISGAVLQEAIERTFKDFVKVTDKKVTSTEGMSKADKRRNSAIFGETLLSLNEMMLKQD